MNMQIYKLFYVCDIDKKIARKDNNDYDLTLKAPNKKCGRRHFNFLLLSSGKK